MRKYVVGTLGFVITAGILTILAIICTIAALILQDVVRKTPENLRQSEMTNTLISYPRREGLFRICHTNNQNDTELQSSSIECVDRDLGLRPNSRNNRDLVYHELIEWRRTALATLAVALFLAVIGLALMVFFLRFWIRTLTIEDYRGHERFSVAFILLLSGMMYKSGLLCLHLDYFREKVLYTSVLPYIFTSWPLVIRRNTDIRYSHSYNLLWASLIMIELAAILLLLCMLLSRYLDRDEEELMEKTINYQLSLPRYSTWDTQRAADEPEEVIDEKEDDFTRPRKSVVSFNVD